MSRQRYTVPPINELIPAALPALLMRAGVIDCGLLHSRQIKPTEDNLLSHLTKIETSIKQKTIVQYLHSEFGILFTDPQAKFVAAIAIKADQLVFHEIKLEDGAVPDSVLNDILVLHCGAFSEIKENEVASLIIRLANLNGFELAAKKMDRQTQMVLAVEEVFKFTRSKELLEQDPDLDLYLAYGHAELDINIARRLVALQGSNVKNILLKRMAEIDGEDKNNCIHMLQRALIVVDELRVGELLAPELTLSPAPELVPDGFTSEVDAELEQKLLEQNQSEQVSKIARYLLWGTYQSSDDVIPMHLEQLRKLRESCTDKDFTNILISIAEEIVSDSETKLMKLHEQERKEFEIEKEYAVAERLIEVYELFDQTSMLALPVPGDISLLKKSLTENGVDNIWDIALDVCKSAKEKNLLLVMVNDSKHISDSRDLFQTSE